MASGQAVALTARNTTVLYSVILLFTVQGKDESRKSVCLHSASRHADRRFPSINTRPR